MTNEEIKKAVEEYFNQMLAKDTDYLDHVTDSWIYYAENWFLCKYSRDWDDKENFRYYARKRFAELYNVKYGARDAKYCLHRIYVIKTTYPLDTIKYVNKLAELSSLKDGLKEIQKLQKELGLD